MNPAPAPTSTGAATTTGAQSSLRTTGGVRREDRAGSKGVAAPSRPIGTGTQGTGTTVGGNSDFAQRAAGGTAGTTVRGGQSVFASSVPSKGKGKGKGKGKPGSASAPSTRSATGDLWNGFKPASRSSVFAAQSSAGKSDGNGTTAATVVAALGLGLAGLTGGLLMLGMRRRRAESRPTAGGNGTTEM